MTIALQTKSPQNVPFQEGKSFFLPLTTPSTPSPWLPSLALISLPEPWVCRKGSDIVRARVLDLHPRGEANRNLPTRRLTTTRFPPQWCGIQWRPALGIYLLAKTRQAAWEPARRRRLRNRLLKSLSTKCRPEALEKMIGITVCRMVFKPYGRMRFIMQLVINSTCLPFDAHLCLHHSEKGPWLCLAYVFSNVCTRNAPKNYDQTGLLAEIRRQTPHCRGQSVRR